MLHLRSKKAQKRSKQKKFKLNKKNNRKRKKEERVIDTKQTEKIYTGEYERWLKCIYTYWLGVSKSM